LGLDHWARERKSLREPVAPAWNHLLAIARRADPDAWRNRVRDAWESDQGSSLAKLADSPEVRHQPAESLSLLIEVTDPKGAEKVLRLAVLKYADDFWINFQSGWTFEHLSSPDWAEAIRYYTTAVALRPRNIPAQAKLATALRNHGKTDEAAARSRRVIEMALALEPGSAARLTSLGCVLQDEGELDQAIAVYRKAIALEPANEVAHNNIACCMLALYQKSKTRSCRESAIVALRNYLKIVPSNRAFRQHLGILFQDAEQWDAAIEEFEVAVHLDPADLAGLALLRDALDLRLRQFASSKDAASCRTAAERWECLNRAEASSLFDAARFRAVVAAVLQARSNGDGNASDTAAEVERAMNWLTQSVAAGFDDVRRIQADGALDPLRGREDFRALLAKLSGANAPRSR
jgi:tetratricopeptide (TPR) repeat protein